MKRETPPESAAIHRIADQRTLHGLPRQQFADRAADSDTTQGRVTR